MTERIATYNYLILKASYESGLFRTHLAEGGSRSGKTWSISQFIIELCIKSTGLVITIGRDTRVNLNDTTFKTLEKVMKTYPDVVYTERKSPNWEGNLNGNLIRFVGVSDHSEKAHGMEQDILWLNEAINLPEMTFKQMNMRTSKYVILDYNPSSLDSFVYKLELDTRTSFCKSTVLHNSEVPIEMRLAIMDYEPTEAHIEKGTANKFLWEVYGLGKRATDETTIFPNWEYYEKEPDGYDYIIHGGDFGYHPDPATVVQCIVDGKNLYLRVIVYGTKKSNEDLANELHAYAGGVWEDPVVFDSAEPKSIQELLGHDIPALNANKGPGSIAFGLKRINSFRIFVHTESVALHDELRNYRYHKDKAGNMLKDKAGNYYPEVTTKGVKYDHCLDAVRYALTKYVNR